MLHKGFLLVFCCYQRQCVFFSNMNMITGEHENCKSNVVGLAVKYRVWALVIGIFDANSVKSISEVGVSSNKKSPLSCFRSLSVVA